MATLHGMVVDRNIPVYSYDWLCEKMRDRGRVALRYNLNGNAATIYGIINGIRPEDGSGNHWLVTIVDNHAGAFGNTIPSKAEVYVRTA